MASFRSLKDKHKVLRMCDLLAADFLSSRQGCVNAGVPNSRGFCQGEEECKFKKRDVSVSVKSVSVGEWAFYTIPAR